MHTYSMLTALKQENDPVINTTGYRPPANCKAWLEFRTVSNVFEKSNVDEMDMFDLREGVP